MPAENARPEWVAADRYLNATLMPADDALDAALAANAAAGLPAIDVAPNQGRLLQLLAQMMGARRILEIGTLGGYSTLWLARALPPQDPASCLVTLELEPRHAEVARANLERGGVAERIDLRVGPALESLARLVEEHAAPFDFIFIDADKPSNPQYLEFALQLSRPGTVIVGDNILRDGQVIDAASPDPRVQGTRRFLEALGTHPQLAATAVQTVGGKGWDGFSLALVLPA